MRSFLKCSDCGGVLKEEKLELVCSGCATGWGNVVNGIPIYIEAVDKEGFFDRLAAERLSKRYLGYDADGYRSSLEKVELWEMDDVNKFVGIIKKFWWENITGKFTGKRILEVGCGVNYLVPYWLQSDNDVVAFDICHENVALLREILGNIGLLNDRIDFAVADVQTVNFSDKFDVVSINNVLHHVEDKKVALKRVRDLMSDDGRLLIVEPNYYYPPRWMIETTMFDPINLVKNYFVRNDLIEKGEKGIIFSEMRQDLANAGFRIEMNQKDKNFLGYFLTYWMMPESLLPRFLYALDQRFFGPLVPSLFAPFEYIIAVKN